MFTYEIRKIVTLLLFLSGHFTFIIGIHFNFKKRYQNMTSLFYDVFVLDTINIFIRSNRELTCSNANAGDFSRKVSKGYLKSSDFGRDVFSAAEKFLHLILSTLNPRKATHDSIEI